jgi:DNA-binding CsgD family transcriptional regulator
MDPSGTALISRMYESLIDPRRRSVFQRDMGTLLSSLKGNSPSGPSLGRLPSTGAVGQDASLSSLDVYAAIASRITEQFESLEKRCELWSVVFASIPAMAMLVGSDLTLKICSDAGKRLLDTRDGLVVVNGKLVASQHYYTIELRNCVKATPSGKLRLMSIPRTGGGHLLLSFVPLKTSSMNPEAITLVQVVDPGQVLRIEADSLSKLFGLTRAEAALACEIASGATLEQAAHKLSVRPSTIKTHLKRIFRKTNTTRQSELIALLLRIATIC